MPAFDPWRIYPDVLHVLDLAISPDSIASFLLFATAASGNRDHALSQIRRRYFQWASDMKLDAGYLANPKLFTQKILQPSSTTYPAVSQKFLKGAAARMMCYFICGMACERASGSDDLVDKFLCWMFPCLFETGTISPNIEYPRESIMWSWIWGLSCWVFSAIGIFHCLLSCPKQKTYSIYTSSCVGLDFPIWDIATCPRWKHEKWNYKVHGKPFPGAYRLLHPLGRELVRTLFTVRAKMNIYIYGDRSKGPCKEF